MTGFAVIDPYTGVRGSEVPFATPDELEAAVASVWRAWTQWVPSTTVEERAAAIGRVADLHEERKEELADILVREMGKPRAQAVGEAEFAGAIYRFYADNGLAGVVVLAPSDGDRLITPEDPRAVIGRALALRDRLRLATPVHVPARVDDGGNRVWDEYYAVRQSPLVLLVGPDDRVLFSAAAPADWSALDRAIVDALADGAEPREPTDDAVAKSPVQ